jgi:hypothetical protein
MADTTIAEINDLVGQLLGDPLLEVFDAATQRPFIGLAYREFWDLMMQWDLQKVNRTVYYTLPANTSSLTPATMGVSDWGEPENLWERGSSAEPWAHMRPVDFLPDPTPRSVLGLWAYEGDTLLFVPSTSIRYLKVDYIASGSCPTSGPVGIDNSLSFLATRTASWLAGRNMGPGEADRLKREALGPNMEADGSGGLLRGLIHPMLLEKQKRPKRPGRFRSRRLMERMIY